MSDQAPGPHELRFDSSIDNKRLQWLLAKQQELQAEIAALLPPHGPRHPHRSPFGYKLEQQQQKERFFSRTSSKDSGYRSDTASQTKLLKSKARLEPSNDKNECRNSGAVKRRRSHSRDSAYASNENSITRVNSAMPEEEPEEDPWAHLLEVEH
ncbi:hypothetical protein N431DRAFT_475106 [Stipitochalara longipes BDJ]|nr:hypothetical protein N431DRAFT_475106 [Stipitochalara longipes BDJ]